MTATVPVLLDETAAKLRAAGIELPRREARLLLAHALGLPGDSLVLTGTPTHLPKDVAEKLLAAFKRRLAGVPLAYVLGRKEFWSLEFAVGPGVLVPRPESETLVEEALRAFPERETPLKVLDLGTGSGCLLLAFLRSGRRASGLGIDISQDALGYARAQCRGTSGLGRVRRSKNATGRVRPRARFDAIFVNPPYLTESEFATSNLQSTRSRMRRLLAGPTALTPTEAWRRPSPGRSRSRGQRLHRTGPGPSRGGGSHIFGAGA